MTIREFYQSVIEANFSEETTNKANELLNALDARNEKRKSTESKEKKEASARRDSVLDFLKNNPNEVFTRDQIAEAINITPAQVTAACRVLTDHITKSEAKFDKAKKVVYQYNG